MIAHELKIGGTIYDIHSCQWGEVSLINHKNEHTWLNSDDNQLVITYTPYNSEGDCEAFAEDCYPLEVGRYFWGEDVCMEIRMDEFDFYCPNRDENCWAFECTDSD